MTNLPRKSFQLLLIVFNLLLAGCDPTSSSISVEDSSIGSEVTIVDPITYDDIYHQEITKTPPLSGAALYKASDGYHLTLVQGYNAFYYKYLENDYYFLMSQVNDGWQHGGAKIINGQMTSTNEISAVREFYAPVTGSVRISGNPYLIEGSSLIVSIYQNNTLISEEIIRDRKGIYHESTIAVKMGDSINFVVEGTGTAYWNPTIDYTLSSEKSLHHAVDGYYGDVHPFYDQNSGQLYMYYLSTALQQNGPVKEKHATLLAKSANFIQYTDAKVINDPDNFIGSRYFVLGVFQDKDGKYRSSYGQGNRAGTSVSTDLVTWGNGSTPFLDNDGQFNYKYEVYFGQGVTSGRDPDIYYDPETDKYYCVAINYYSAERESGEKGLALYIGDTNGVFSTKYTKLLDTTGRGDPECPQLKKIGNRWYLFYSIYGTGSQGGVGKPAYRMGDVGVSPEMVDWDAKEERYLDGGNLRASQVVEVGDKFYLYGWINYEVGRYVWGGYLNLPHEIYQLENGLLRTRADEGLLKLLNRGRIASFKEDNLTLNNMSFSNDVVISNGPGSAYMNGQYKRNLIETTITMPNEVNSSSITLKQGDQTILISLVRRNTKTYLEVTRRIGQNYFEYSSIEIDEKDKTIFDIKAVIDSKFIEVFCNDQYSLIAHTHIDSNNPYQIGIEASGNNVRFSNTTVYKLADYNNIYD